jgi:GT2 family glycosyltransferase
MYELIKRVYRKVKTAKHKGIDNVYQADYELIGSPKVSIIIPNKDHLELLKPCVESILKKTTYSNYEIVIVENNSVKEETFEYYNQQEDFNKVRIIYYPGKGFNYHKIINYGVRSCSSEYIVQLNNDIKLITPNWLELMLGLAQRGDVGAVGAKLYFPDKRVQHAGGVLTPNEWLCCSHIFTHAPQGTVKGVQDISECERLVRKVTWVTGACLLSSKEIYEQVGCMDEDFEVVFGDVDFCMKIRAIGKYILYHPLVEMIHDECSTRGFVETTEDQAVFTKDRELFIKKWQKELTSGDPYYPNYRSQKSL